MKIIHSFLNFKLVYKFTGLFLLMAMIVTAIGGFGIWSTRSVSDRIQTMMQVRSAQENMAVLMKVTMQECRVNLLEAIMVHDTDEAFREHKGEYEEKHDRFIKYIEIFLKGDPRIGIAAAPPGSNLEQRIRTIQKEWADFATVADGLLYYKADSLKKFKPGAMHNAAVEAQTDRMLSDLEKNNLVPVVDKINAAIDDLLVTVVSHMNETADEAASIKRKAEITIVLVIVTSVLLAILLGMVPTTKIVINPIMKIKEAAEKVASGDFSNTLLNDENRAPPPRVRICLP